MGCVGTSKEDHEQILDDLTPQARAIISATLARVDAEAERARDRALLDTVPCPGRACDAALRAWMEEARKEQGITRAASMRDQLVALGLYRTNGALMAAITEAYREGLYDGLHPHKDGEDNESFRTRLLEHDERG